jgi:D-alanine-D-alanine ligase
MTRIGFAYNQKPVSNPGAPSPRSEGSPAPRPDRSASPRPDRSVSAALRSDRAGIGAGLSAGDESDAGGSGDDEPPSSPLLTASVEADDEFAEWDSAETIDAVEHALSALGTVVRLEANLEFPARLRAARPDIVFNIAEGLAGVNREAHVPAICEYYGIPYSGSDPFTLSLCLDKARTKQILAYYDVPTARFAVVNRAADIPAAVGALRYPLFVKPLHEGSSKGITERNLCRTVGELDEQVRFLLERYAEPVLVEEYLAGDEFTCAVLGNGADAQLLPIVGLNFGALPPGALPIYGFEAKWLWDRPERPLPIFECPARIDEELRRQIERVSLAAYRALGCRDWSRLDVRLDAAGVPHVIEVNPLPGILPDPADNSCFPKAARAAGLSYDELIQTCVMLAASRQRVVL